jgi:hypothetical protein
VRSVRCHPAVVDEATPVMSDGSDGAVLKLRELFEQFFSKVR